MPSSTLRLPKCLRTPSSSDGVPAAGSQVRRAAPRMQRAQLAGTAALARRMSRRARTARLTSGAIPRGKRDDHDHEREPMISFHMKADCRSDTRADQSISSVPMHRADQRAAAAERDPDDELGAEHEAGVAPARRPSCTPANRRSRRSRRRRPRPSSAAVLTRDVSMPRYSQRVSFSRIATRMRPASLRTNSQHRPSAATRNAPAIQNQAVDRRVEALEAREAAARTGEGAAGIEDLRHDDRQHQRDHRA